MSIVDKLQVTKNFNKSVDSYETEASVQRLVAKQLMQFVAHSTFHSILEVGCGTGVLTRELLTVFPEASFLLTDISDQMINKIYHTHSNDKIHTFCIDGEAFHSKITFDLIISSMTMHWFNQLKKSLLNLSNYLKKQGSFAFSIVGANTFREWKDMCDQAGIISATPYFPSEKSLREIFPESTLAIKYYPVTYKNAHSFLRALKKLGATGSRLHYKPLSPGQLRQVLHYFNTSITVTYEIIFIHWVKK